MFVWSRQSLLWLHKTPVRNASLHTRWEREYISSEDSSAKSSLDNRNFLFVFFFIFFLAKLTSLSPHGQAAVPFPLLSAPSNQHKITEKALQPLTGIFGLTFYQENRHIKNVGWLEVNQNGKLKCKNIWLHINTALHAHVDMKTQTQSSYGQPYLGTDTVQE